MKKAKIAALGLAAVITLAGCATTDAYTDLLITGGDDLYQQRNQLVAQARNGANVSGQIAAVCSEWLGVDAANHDYQWQLFCENPDYVWDASHNTWLSYTEATAYGN